MEITSIVVEQAAVRAADAFLVRAGAELAATVREAPPDGGHGLLSLAGGLLRATLPPGLAAGQEVRLHVVDVTPERVVLRLAGDAATASPPSSGIAHGAGALAVSGHPELVRAAATLAPPGLALPLPNGDALQLAVEDDGPAGGGGSADAEAGFVLHSAALGPIEVRLRLGGGAVSASVAVPDQALPAARSAAPELAAALARATGAAPRVAVSTRRQAAAARPVVAEGLDAYA